MNETIPPTRIYLLSAWVEDNNDNTGRPALRFSLEDPRTGERQGFNSPQALVAFFESDVTNQSKAKIRMDSNRGGKLSGS